MTGSIAATNIPCHLNSHPSQFALQDFVIAEADQIFTLDLLNVDASQDLRPDDVIQVTTGHPLLQGGYWKLRGDKKPKTWRAAKQQFVIARLSQPPAWVAALA